MFEVCDLSDPVVFAMFYRKPRMSSTSPPDRINSIVLLYHWRLSDDRQTKAPVKHCKYIRYALLSVTLTYTCVDDALFI